MKCYELTEEVIATVLNARDKDLLGKIAEEWSCSIEQAFQTMATRALSDLAVRLADEKGERIGERPGD